MAIQFANTAQNIIAGQSAGAGLMSAYSNAARNLGQSIQGIGSNIGEGLGVIIQRQREKKAAQMLEDATEEKRRYLAGDFKDDEDRAALEARYSIPESEQFTALAARIRPWSSSLSEGLLDRAKQAKAAEAQQSAIQAQTEADILKMGGDPRTIRLETHLKNLRDQQSALLKDGLDGLNVLNLNAVLKQQKELNRQINAANAEMARVLGFGSGETSDTPTSQNPSTEAAGATAEAEAPAAEYELTPEAEKIAAQKVLPLRSMTSPSEVKSYLEEVARDETLDPAVRWAVSTVGWPYYKQLLSQDKEMRQLDQREREREMQKGEKLFSRFNSTAQRAAAEFSALEEVLASWGNTAPANYSEAQTRLRTLGSALQSIAAIDGKTAEDSSLVDAIRQAFGLASRSMISKEAYNRAVGDTIAAVYGRAKTSNDQVNGALELADTPYLRKLGEALLVKGLKRLTFTGATSDYYSKDDAGAGEGGPQGPTPEEIARAREVTNRAKNGGK